MNILVDGALAQIALDGVSPTKIMNTATTNKNTGLAFTSDIERIQKVLVERMPLDEADRILNVFLKIITGETSDVRDQGEVRVVIIAVALLCFLFLLFSQYIFRFNFQLVGTLRYAGRRCTGERDFAEYPGGSTN